MGDDIRDVLFRQPFTDHVACIMPLPRRTMMKPMMHPRRQPNQVGGQVVAALRPGNTVVSLHIPGFPRGYAFMAGRPGFLVNDAFTSLRVSRNRSPRRPCEQLADLVHGIAENVLCDLHEPLQVDDRPSFRVGVSE